MFKTLQVSARGFYGWPNRPMCQRQKANIRLTAQIRQEFVASDGSYGLLSIPAEVLDAGIKASSKCIAALLRQGKMRGVSRRRSFCFAPSKFTLSQHPVLI